MGSVSCVLRLSSFSMHTVLECDHGRCIVLPNTLGIILLHLDIVALKVSLKLGSKGCTYCEVAILEVQRFIDDSPLCDNLLCLSFH